MITTLKTMIRDEEGATMVEYGLLVALIALVAIVGVTLLGKNLSTAVHHRRGLSLETRATRDAGAAARRGRAFYPFILSRESESTHMLTLRALWRDEAGAQLVEYVLLASTYCDRLHRRTSTLFGQGVLTLYNNAANSF